MIKLSSGGAGIGVPTDREPEAGAAGRGNEFVTLEAAERIYGVAIDPETLDGRRGQDRGTAGHRDIRDRDLHR